MNALTLYQPWASLVAMGAKTIETRSWRPPAAAIGERLAIHAAAGVSPWPWPEGITWRDVWPPGESAESMTRPAEQWMVANGREVKLQLPRGAVVASCVLADVVPIVGDHDDAGGLGRYISTTGDSAFLWHDRDEEPHTETLADFMGEVPFGDFSPGRFAWLLEDVKPTTEPIPCKGRQGLWKLPPEIEEQFRDA